MNKELFIVPADHAGTRSDVSDWVMGGQPWGSDDTQ